MSRRGAATPSNAPNTVVVQLPASNGSKLTQASFELNLVDLHKMALESMRYVADSFRHRGLEKLNVGFNEETPNFTELTEGAHTSMAYTDKTVRSFLEVPMAPSRIRRFSSNSTSSSCRSSTDPEEDDCDDDDDDASTYSVPQSRPLRRQELQSMLNTERPIRIYIFKRKNCGFNCDAYYTNPKQFPFHPMMSQSGNGGGLELETLKGPSVMVNLVDLGISGPSPSATRALQRRINASPFNAMWRAVFAHCLMSASTSRNVTIDLLGLRLEYIEEYAGAESFSVSFHITVQHSK